MYKMVVRPAMMYGRPTGAVKKAQERKLVVAEMMMLRWMRRVTKPDRSSRAQNCERFVAMGD